MTNTYSKEKEELLKSLGINPKEQPFKVINELLKLIPEQLDFFNIKQSERRNENKN